MAASPDDTAEDKDKGDKADKESSIVQSAEHANAASALSEAEQDKQREERELLINQLKKAKDLANSEKTVLDTPGSGDDAPGVIKNPAEDSAEDPTEGPGAIGLSAAEQAKQKEEREIIISQLKKAKESAKTAKTVLDTDALRDVAAKTLDVQADKLREQIEALASAPAKPYAPISNYRKASPCSSTWDKMSGDGCLKFCEQCKLMVYDFNKIELPEAEQIIAQREDKKKFVLYKRKDGKFLTKDCPVGAARKQVMLLTMTVPVLFLLAGVVFLLTLPPPPPPPPPQPVEENKAESDDTSSAAVKSQAVNSDYREERYVVGPDGKLTRVPINAHLSASSAADSAPPVFHPALGPGSKAAIEKIPQYAKSSPGFKAASGSAALGGNTKAASYAKESATFRGASGSVALGPPKSPPGQNQAGPNAQAASDSSNAQAGSAPR